MDEKKIPENNQNQPGRAPRYNRSIFNWVIIIAIAILIFSVMSSYMDDMKKIDITEFWAYVDNNQLSGELIVRTSRIEGEIRDQTGRAKGESSRFYLEYFISNDSEFLTRLNERLKKAGSDIQVYCRPDSWFAGALPHLLLFFGVLFLMWFFLFRRLGGAGGGGGFLGNFGRSKHRLVTKEQSQVTFDDVAGIDDAKEEVKEIIEFLKDPKRFSRLGGRVPRGVLLVGEPGCGKTMLAKSIAGEANVPFFSISGSDFVEMFVGVGASRVRDLFKQAKDSAPCIIFLDEIDAVGRRRSVDHPGGSQETAQTLNAILVEMDGFDSNDQVIVCAATNRADVLDPALTRPGRFDRQITVPLPDLKGRFEILRIYADKITCAEDVDLHKVARGTPMFSGADLAALVNESAISATLAGKDFVEQEDLEDARDKVRWGRSRKRHVLDEKERRITAYHEAGHAIVQELLPDADPLHKVSIIPRGPSLGATFALPEKDRYMYSKKYCMAELQVLFAGRLAEETYCNDVTSGAQSDISRATEMARKMVLDWGMSERLGVINYTGDERRYMWDFGTRDYSEKTAEMIDEEIRKITDEALNSAKQLLKDNGKVVEQIAEALLKYETLTAEEVRLIMEGKTLSKPTVDDLLNSEMNKPAGGEADESENASEPSDIPSVDVPPMPEPG